MDDVMVRSRYPRHSIPARRRSRYGKDKNKLPALIIKQLAACLILFLVVIAVKNINTSFTNSISEKVSYALKQNFELNSILKTVENAFVSLSNGNLLKKVKETENNTSDGQSPESSVLSASTDEAGDLTANMIAPVKGVLSSPFGERKDPVSGMIKQHEGIDIDSGKVADIAVALDGVVIDTGSSKSYGKYVKIRHDERFETVYAHCSSVNVIQGQRVAQGDIIAKVGNTGASVGTHLHFEIWKDGKPVNPLEYIGVPLPEQSAGN